MTKVDVHLERLQECLQGEARRVLENFCDEGNVDLLANDHEVVSNENGDL